MYLLYILFYFNGILSDEVVIERVSFTWWNDDYHRPIIGENDEPGKECSEKCIDKLRSGIWQNFKDDKMNGKNSKNNNDPSNSIHKHIPLDIDFNTSINYIKESPLEGVCPDLHLVKRKSPTQLKYIHCPKIFLGCYINFDRDNNELKMSTGCITEELKNTRCPIDSPSCSSTIFMNVEETYTLPPKNMFCCLPGVFELLKADVFYMWFAPDSSSKKYPETDLIPLISRTEIRDCVEMSLTLYFISISGIIIACIIMAISIKRECFPSKKKVRRLHM